MAQSRQFHGPMMLNVGSLKGARAKWMADPTLNHSKGCHRARY